MTSPVRALIVAGLISFANAHATCTVDEMTTSDKYMATSIRIGHNCGYDGGEYTTGVIMKFLSYSNFAIQSVKGGMMLDWSLSHTTRSVDSSLGYDSLSSTYDTVSFTYTGDKEGMAADEFLDFPLKFKLADADGNFPFSVGDVMYIPTLQICNNNTYRDWANGTIWPRSSDVIHKDDYHDHLPSITVVSDDDSDDDATTKKYYSQSDIVGIIALVIAIIVLLAGVFIILRMSERIAKLEKAGSETAKELPCEVVVADNLKANGDGL